MIIYIYKPCVLEICRNWSLFPIGVAGLGYNHCTDWLAFYAHAPGSVPLLRQRGAGGLKRDLCKITQDPVSYFKDHCQYMGTFTGGPVKITL